MVQHIVHFVYPVFMLSDCAHLESFANTLPFKHCDGLQVQHGGQQAGAHEEHAMRLASGKSSEPLVTLTGQRSCSGGDAFPNPPYQVQYGRQATGLDLSCSHAAEMHEAKPLDQEGSAEELYSTLNMPLGRMMTSHTGGASGSSAGDGSERSMRVSSHALL